MNNGAGTPEAAHFEINVAAQYTAVSGAASATVPSIEVNYGITDNLQVSILTPLQLALVVNDGAKVGYGDTELGVKYRFIDPDDAGWRPGIAFAPSIVMPSGSQERGLGSGHIQGSLPIRLSKDFDQWTIFGGGGYNINPGPEQLNWWFTGIGIVRELSPKWTVGAEIFHTSPTARSSKDTAGFNVGAVYSITDVHHIMASVGRSLTNAQTNNELSAFLGYQATF